MSPNAEQHEPEWEPRTPDAEAKSGRLNAAEVRRRMLLQAQEFVWARGFTVVIEDLSMEDLIRDTQVPRSSVFRLWSTRAKFMDSLLEFLGGPQDGGLRAAAFDIETQVEAARVAYARRDQLNSPEGRRAAFLEAVRLGANQNYKALAASPYWRAFSALTSTVGSISRPEARFDISASMIEAERNGFIAEMSGFYSVMAQVFGVRLRSKHLSYEQLTVAGAAAIEGMSARKVLLDAHTSGGQTLRRTPSVAADSLRDVVERPVPMEVVPGSEGPWSLAALAFLSVIDNFTEPDPDAQAPDLEALGVTLLLDLAEDQQGP